MEDLVFSTTHPPYLQMNGLWQGLTMIIENFQKKKGKCNAIIENYN